MSQAPNGSIQRPLQYIREISDYRNFWISLARLNLKNRFRRTQLGILWTMVQPLLFALTIALVFRYMFQRSFVDLSIYILSGIILWELFQQTILSGANAVIAAGHFIKQKRLPLAIYPLEIYLGQVVTFLIALVGLVIWIFAPEAQPCQSIMADGDTEHRAHPDLSAPHGRLGLGGRNHLSRFPGSHESGFDGAVVSLAGFHREIGI